MTSTHSHHCRQSHWQPTVDSCSQQLPLSTALLRGIIHTADIQLPTIHRDTMCIGPTQPLCVGLLCVGLRIATITLCAVDFHLHCGLFNIFERGYGGAWGPKSPSGHRGKALVGGPTELDTLLLTQYTFWCQIGPFDTLLRSGKLCASMAKGGGR